MGKWNHARAASYEEPRVETPVPQKKHISYMEQRIHRPLGGPEKLFLVLDQLASKSFALVVTVEGELPTSTLRLALDAVQQRHPQLSAGIKMDAELVFWLDNEVVHPIPLKVLETSAPSDWKKVVEEEIAQPFELENGPLLRLVQLCKPGESTLIAVVHHSIGDGYSLALLLHDLFSFVVGQPLTPLAAPQPMDEHLHLAGPLTERLVAAGKRVFKPIGLGQATAEAPSIDYLKLSAELTARLIAASRQHATTVNTLLNAALVVAGAKLTPTWNERPVVVRSPASTREALQVGNDFGLYAVTKPLAVVVTPTTTVPELVRVIQQGLADIKSAQYAAGYVQRLRGLLLKSLEISALLDIMKAAPGIDFMLTNLGRASLPGDWGTLRITSFWGPIVMAGDGTEQTVGAITFNDQLHLTQSSLKPVKGLLEAAVQVLEEFCAAA
jgi:hypothetical protein